MPKYEICIKKLEKISKKLLQFSKKHDIISTQSVMLSLCTEVIQMKYEMPTCEIVLLERADCLTTSGQDPENTYNVRPEDSPYVDYVPTV